MGNPFARTSHLTSNVRVAIRVRPPRLGYRFQNHHARIDRPAYLQVDGAAQTIRVEYPREGEEKPPEELVLQAPIYVDDDPAGLVEDDESYAVAAAGWERSQQTLYEDLVAPVVGGVLHGQQGCVVCCGPRDSGPRDLEPDHGARSLNCRR